MSNQKQEVTVKDVIDATIRELKSVSIPAYLVQDENLVRAISFPVNRAINNLNVILQAFENAEQPSAKNEEPDEVIELFAGDDEEPVAVVPLSEEGGSENAEKD